MDQKNNGQLIMVKKCEQSEKNTPLSGHVETWHFLQLGIARNSDHTVILIVHNCSQTQHTRSKRGIYVLKGAGTTQVNNMYADQYNYGFGNFIFSLLSGLASLSLCCTDESTKEETVLSADCQSILYFCADFSFNLKAPFVTQEGLERCLVDSSARIWGARIRGV